MTPASEPRRSPEEIAQLGEDIYERRIRPELKPEDDGKFAAIDIVTEDYEIDAHDYSAITRLSARRRGAEIWLRRVGHPAAYKTRFR